MAKFKQKLTDSRENFRDSLVLVLREYAEALAIAIVLALLLRIFVVSAYKIPTSAMAPSLKIGDFIFAYKLPYGDHWNWLKGKGLRGRLPARGEVVVFKCPQNTQVTCIKRVVALPGDRVQIVKKRLFVNNRRARYNAGDPLKIEDLAGKEFYAVVDEKLLGHTRSVLISRSKANENFGPLVVPPGHFFVLGDNRDGSDDSRFWGPVPLKNLQGRALMIWLSLDWKTSESGTRWPSMRWERLFSAP